MPAFDILDALPDSLYQAVVTHSRGALLQRCQAILYWRRSLLLGELPELTAWPDVLEQQSFIQQLQQSSLLSGLTGRENICDRALLSWLEYLDGKHPDLQLPDADGNAIPPKISPDSMHSGDTQMDALLRDFSIRFIPGQDLRQGVWTQGDLRKLLRLHAFVRQSGYLRRILQLIGRGKNHVYAGAQSQDDLQPALSPVRRHESVTAIMRTRGIYQSDDISRMLSAELLLLGHPLLKSLWHARRAERRLLCYQYEGVLPTHTPDFDVQPDASRQLSHQVRQQGPLVLCLDTSASMSGNPEQRARAVVLEAMRVAMIEHRRCLLFMFSGPGDVRMLELDHSIAGWRNLLRLIRHGFYGGTDVAGILLRAIEHVQHGGWRDADICLISDGRFSAATIYEQIQSLRQTCPARIHGLHVSRWNSKQMEAICDQVYRLDHLN